MKLKFLSALIALLMIVSMCAPCVLGAESVEVRLDAQENTLIISGFAPDNASEYITVEILNDGVAWTRATTPDSAVLCLDEFDPTDSADNILNYLSYFDMVKPGTDKSFTLIVRGFVSDIDPEVRILWNTEDFFYYSPKSLLEINKAQTEAEIKNAVLANTYIQRQTEEYYASLEPFEEDMFWKLFLNYKDSVGGFSTLAAVVEAFDDYIYLAKLHSADTVEKMKSFITFCTQLGIMESNSYDLYSNTGDFSDGQLTSTQKSALIENLKSERISFTSVESFFESFWDKAILYACSQNVSKYNVRDVLTTADRLSDVDMGTFYSESTAAKTDISDKINQNEIYSSLVALANGIKGYLNSKEESYPPSTSNGGGSGGGSSGGGTSGKVVAIVETDSINTENNTDGSFTDLSDVKWAEEAIYALKDKGIISGRDEKTFDPTSPITREEFVKILTLAMDCYDENANTSFSDVSKDAWYYSYVASAVNKGIVKGIDDKNFGVGRIITRQEMATLIARCKAGEKLANASHSGFSDDALISDWARDAVFYVRENGLLSGVGENMFAPLSPVTRAQAAKAIYNMM